MIIFVLFFLKIYNVSANKSPNIFARNHGKFQYFQINISYFGYWQIVMQRKWLTFSLPVVYLWYYPSMFVYDNLFVTRTKDFDTYIATLKEVQLFIGYCDCFRTRRNKNKQYLSRALHDLRLICNRSTQWW